MEKIVVSHLFHRNEDRIKVVVPHNSGYIDKIRQISGRLWSKTHNCWHLPYTNRAWNELRKTFGDLLEVEKNKIPGKNLC